MQGRTIARVTQAKACFSALGRITTRSQFGGYGLLADGIMFAVVAEGEMYLRATRSLESVFRARGMANMVYSKRGAPIVMRYYYVDEALWQQRQELFALAWEAMREARREVEVKNQSHERLKDLPNIDAALERLLWRTGICGVYDLRLQGPKETFLRLQQEQHRLGQKVLLSLAGALAGYHHAALPTELRAELLAWFNAVIMPPTQNSLCPHRYA
ncbi:TfoX/Sxy family DNA transformation protein [Serratia sp. AKBS12]|uniref:TfoX/Sxy family DNA transformation protein n=1 Tax=Serratia sp. AKBS12 TaxID=2974597 RepID=UPI002165224C|nr:TfoX/Sxy family DNA transformation protein [Serratia sp. AKBS12]MCS3409194.1 TfoX/Sxy family DNA transformation protein [Serratia sp. AKBS12]